MEGKRGQKTQMLGRQFLAKRCLFESCTRERGTVRAGTRQQEGWSPEQLSQNPVCFVDIFTAHSIMVVLAHVMLVILWVTCH